MSKKKIIVHINLIASIGALYINDSIRSRRLNANSHSYSTGFSEATVLAMSTSAGLMAKELGIASMTYDRPAAIKLAA